MANYSETASVLARWRAVERELAEAEDGSPEMEQLQAEAARLRDEVRRLTNPEATAAAVNPG